MKNSVTALRILQRPVVPLPKDAESPAFNE